MARQHASPILLSNGISSVLEPVDLRGGEDSVAEDVLRDLICEYPGSLPISEVDPSFERVVSICTELKTPAGFIDNLMITCLGQPVIVECKLWRNPEGRRAVIGQILDYAKELSRWTSSDMQREVNKRLGTSGNEILRKVRAVYPEVDEIAFNDALSANLRRGHFLLLIVGDGIREGVEAISEYLQNYISLHFSLGLVEMPLFRMNDGSVLLTPRVLARSTTMVREVIAIPEGYALKETESTRDFDSDIDRQFENDAHYNFWLEFVSGLRLDDPEQALPKPTKQKNIWLMMPAPGGSCWITVFYSEPRGGLGLFLSANRNSVGEYAVQTIVDDFENVRAELGGDVYLDEKNGQRRLAEFRKFGDISDSGVRASAFAWLGERVNTFVNVLRPRVRSAVADREVVELS